MAQPARAGDETFDGEYVELPATGTVVTPWGDAAPADSPARLLHQRLVESFETLPSHEPKLPVRTRLAIVTGVVLLPWVLGGIALALA